MLGEEEAAKFLVHSKKKCAHAHRSLEGTVPSTKHKREAEQNIKQMFVFNHLLSGSGMSEVALSVTCSEKFGTDH